MQIFFIITILFFVIAVSSSIIIMKITYTSELNLKKISEKISDGYLILNKSFNVTNYNKAFLKYTNLQEKEVKRKIESYQDRLRMALLKKVEVMKLRYDKCMASSVFKEPLRKVNDNYLLIDNFIMTQNVK